jgi:hypothetical protein
MSALPISRPAYPYIRDCFHDMSTPRQESVVGSDIFRSESVNTSVGYGAGRGWQVIRFALGRIKIGNGPTADVPGDGPSVD